MRLPVPPDTVQPPFGHATSHVDLPSQDTRQLPPGQSNEHVLPSLQTPRLRFTRSPVQHEASSPTLLHGQPGLFLSLGHSTVPVGGGGGGPMGAPMGNASRAVLSGAAGIFTVSVGTEMRAGRDGSVCQILLTEPRVSGCHAAVKVEGGQLLVRDENSNNGTFVNGQRIPGGMWTPVPPGALLRFGPVEFSVRLE